MVICTPGLLRPPKEEKVVPKIGHRDPTVGSGWGVRGLSESQGKSVGASTGLRRISLHKKLYEMLLRNRVLACIVRLR